MDECHVAEYMFPQSPRGRLYLSVVRAPGGVPGFLEKSSRLFRRFLGPIFVFHPDLPSDHPDATRTNIIMNPSLAHCGRVFGVSLSDSQRATLSTITASTSGITSRRTTRRPEPELSLESIFADESFSGGGHGDGASDEELQQAIRVSIQEQEQLAQEQARVTVPLQRSWQNVLRAKSEPVVPGQPVCMVCLQSRASICFVDCGHQVACDECIAIMWSRADVAHSCPVCRSACTQIVRPYTSELAPSATTTTTPPPPEEGAKRTRSEKVKPESDATKAKRLRIVIKKPL
jgi:hypothetical protein